MILNHVSYIYSQGTPFESKAVEDVDLVIEDGEFIGLIGHTGSGKSTLIQQFNGLIKPTSGEVYFDGCDINDKEYDIRKLRTQVGLVFQYPEYQLFETTVFKDVCFGPKNQGLDNAAAGLRAFEALEAVGIAKEQFYQSPFELSGGQQRRVAIAGVLAMKPKILILDEPTAGLDPKGRYEILNLIAKLHKEQGITVILVSHSMEDVADYVGRIVVMDKGSIKYDGTPHQVFAHYREMEAIGLAAPEVTYVMADLEQAGWKVSTDITTIDEARDEILQALRIED